MNTKDDKQGLSRTKLAKEIGVGVETIRYYEKRGLIEPASRIKNSHPVYPKRAFEQLKFIKRAQNAGFTLKEISTLLSLGSDHCMVTKTLAQEKLAAIKVEIIKYKKMESILLTLIEDCNSNGDHEKCGLFEILSDRK